MALFFHSTYVQHDTGEFAGWMRDAIFRKLIRPNGIPFHRWEARLHDIIEIRDFIVASIILRHMPFDHATLQQFIHARHDNKPYSNALCCPSPIYIFNWNITQDLIPTILVQSHGIVLRSIFQYLCMRVFKLNGYPFMLWQGLYTWEMIPILDIVVLPYFIRDRCC